VLCYFVWKWFSWLSSEYGVRREHEGGGVVVWCRMDDCPFRICECFCVLNVSLNLLHVISQRLAYLVDSEYRSKFLSQSGRLGSQDWKASRHWFLHEDNWSFCYHCQEETSCRKWLICVMFVHLSNHMEQLSSF
jgi:hypothetical protein